MENHMQTDNMNIDTEKVKLKFMVVPEQLIEAAYVPNKVRVKIIDPEAIFLMGILGDSGRKLVENGIEFYFEDTLAEKLISKGIAVKIKDKSVGCACIMISPDRRHIYLGVRRGPFQTGKYAAPGGMVDDTDYSPLNGIVRELREETGLDIYPTRFGFFTETYHVGEKSDTTLWYFLQLKPGELPRNIEPEKHSDWTKFTLDEAKKLPLMLKTLDALNNSVISALIER